MMDIRLMRRGLLVGAVALLGIMAAGCSVNIGGGGGESSPTPTVTATVTSSPTSTPPPPPLTLGEQRVLDFVTEYFPQMKTVRDQIGRTVKDVIAGKWIDAAYRTKHFANAFDKIDGQWSRLPVAGGATDQLEQDFQFFINGLRRYGRNVAKVVWATGGGNVGDYANGKARANTYGLRVQHDLNDLREQFGSQPQPAPSSSTIY